MKDDELQRQLESIVPPAANPAARERARMRALAAFHAPEEIPERPWARWPIWVFATGAAFAIAMLALKWPSSSVPPAAAGPGNAMLLAQMEQTFPGELDAVIEQNGQFKLALASRPSGASDQPVLIEFRRGASVVRVLSYSGRHVCVDLGGGRACFEALLDEQGNVIVEGEDFATHGGNSVAVHGWTVEAQSLSHAG